MTTRAPAWALVVLLAGCTPLEGGGAGDLAAATPDGGFADLATPLPGDGGAPPDLATPGSDDGGVPTWCTAGYTAATHTYCGPFEGPGLGAEWSAAGQNAGSILVDPNRSAHGASSLKFPMAAAASTTVTLDLGAVPPPGVPIWVRSYVFLPSASRPPQVKLLSLDGLSLIATQSATQLGNSSDTSGALPLDRWACVEILLTAIDAGHTRFDLFVDGVPRLSGPEAVPPGLSSFVYGGQGPMSSYTVWFDELVISGTRPGCPP